MLAIGRDERLRDRRDETAAAKVVGTMFAEKTIDEGRRVLASRALLEDLPYASFARDVLLYGVFDGTIHVMLEELAFRFERFATAGPDGKDPMSQERHAWTCEPRRLSECGANVPVARLDLRRLAALQMRELFPLQGLQHRLKARRTFGVMGAGIVRKESGMGDEQRRHGLRTL